MKKKEAYETIDLRDKIREIDEQNRKATTHSSETSKINHRSLDRNEIRTLESAGRKPEDKSKGRTSRDKWRAFSWI